MLNSLADLSAPDLGGLAIAEALERAAVDASDVDAVIMGTVVQAGIGPNSARIAAAPPAISSTSPEAVG